MGPWASVGEQADALRRACARAGCRVLSTAPRRTSVGDYLSARIECPDGWAGARLLSALTDEDAQTAGARDAALSIRRAFPDDGAFVAEVFRRAKGLAFTREPGEVFAAGSYTWDVGGGDCDDHARAVVSLLKAGGAGARVVYLHPPGGDPSHAVAQGFIPGRGWVWLESTLPAHLGEPPVMAAARLGRVREDLALDATTLDAYNLTPMPVSTEPPAIVAPSIGALGAIGTANTSDHSPAFYRELAGMAARFRARGAQVTGEDLLAVFLGESGMYASKKGQNADGTWDYGLNMVHDVSGLRAVGWTGTPEAYLALSPEAQLPYVERYFVRMVPANAWPSIRGARGLYAVNAWPGYVAATPGAFLVDEWVIARKGKSAYYSGFDFHGDGTNRPSDIDRWILRAQLNGGRRWIEARSRYWAESGEQQDELSTVGAVKTFVFLTAAGLVSAYVASHG